MINFLPFENEKYLYLITFGCTVEKVLIESLEN